MGNKWIICLVFWGVLGVGGVSYAQEISVLRKVQSLNPEPAENVGSKPDWLIDNQSYKAGVYKNHTGKEIILSNGIVRRVFRLGPNAATIALDNLYSGEAFLRAVKPEAIMVLNTK